jgi:uncharacterized PurR-regulated membrane protein YhhQ (DUF165 family)
MAVTPAETALAIAGAGREVDESVSTIRPLGYVASIFGANWALLTFGSVPVGFDLVAPAGVYLAGLTFWLRDLTHDVFGWRWTFAAVLLGAALSGFLSGPLALASGLAFLVSETTDLLVYAPVRRRNRIAAVGLSNTIGLVVDSALFLWLGSMAVPFISLDQFWGQVVGKGWMTLLAVTLVWGWRAVSQRSD